MVFSLKKKKVIRMIELRKTAILLIYQDGTYDYEEIGLDMFHLPYFRKLKERSKKFRKVIKDLDLDRCNHSEIFLFLAKKGVIEIFNNNLKELIACPEILKAEFNPYFVVSLPQEYASREQKISFYDIIREYNSDLLYFGRCDGSGYISEDDIIKKYVLEDDLLKSRGGR